jgi:hypothetical protein
MGPGVVPRARGMTASRSVGDTATKVHVVVISLADVPLHYCGIWGKTGLTEHVKFWSTDT